MLVQPINVKNFSNLAMKSKSPSFKSVDWSKYLNHDGSPIPDIERLKYSKTKTAENLEKLNEFAKAANEWFDIADICRKQGKERDAYLCETAARKLLKRV